MTKIDWCDEVWNPVWGCLTGCKYCYARGMARRFAQKIAIKEYNFNNDDKFFNKSELQKQLSNFKPTWIESNFNKKFPKKPSRIFVNSMSDVEYWEPEWMSKVIEKIKEYPQHTFIFLTKSPFVYSGWLFPENCWLGASASTRKDFIDRIDTLTINTQDNINFMSVEPIHERLNVSSIDQLVDWLIIGAETGNRKNKIIPEKSWIEEFRNIDIPVFMKDNLRDIVGDNLRQEFPK